MKTAVHPFFTKYICHEDGRIFSTISNKFIKQSGESYYVFSPHSNEGKPTRYTQHRFIAEAFHGLSDLIVNHKDGNKQNNRADNLEWCTYSQNVKHAFDTGLAISIKGENRYNAKLDEIQALTVITFLNTGVGYRKFTSRFKYCTPGMAQRIACNANWKYLEKFKNLELINKRKIQYAKKRN